MAAADIVIPTWNGRELLDRCLDTLERQTVAPNVIVVDNGSSDGTADHVQARRPGITVVRLDRNHGFGAAVNRGIAAGSAPVVVLVNNDVECDPEFLERITAPFAENERLGSVAGVLLAPGRARIDSYGIEVDGTLAGFARFAGAPYPATRLHERGLLGPNGGAAAYRRRALDEIGGFDEAIFAYHEEDDVALRLGAAGWTAAGVPDAIGIHLGSASFGRRSDWQVELSGTSRAYLLRKYGVLRRGPALAARALATELLVVVADALLERRLAAARGRLRGWRRGRSAHACYPETLVNRDIDLRASLARRRAAIAR